METITHSLWLVGAGPMAVDYAIVLHALDKSYTVIGRSETSANAFEEQTKCRPITGGLNKHLDKNIVPETAVVAVSVEQLADCAIQLMKAGTQKILLEKPGGLTLSEIKNVAETAENTNSKVYIAYNRRFYTSVQKAREIIEEDGGVLSFHFEFTEWSHEIKDLKKTPGVKEKWLISNSSHVIDLAFYLGGNPEILDTHYCGNLDWHPASAIFTGSGKTENGALFSYHANWLSAGRWSLEFLTAKHRLHFHPLEKLQYQVVDSVVIHEYPDIDYNVDDLFKPGLYHQTRKFLVNELDDFCSIEDQIVNFELYSNMANY